LKATNPIAQPINAAAQPAPNIQRSKRVSGALRTTASTIEPITPMAPASVGVARPIMMVPRTRKISTAEGMIPHMDFTISGQPRSVRGTGGTAAGLVMLR
jgi:hypothetical protein